MRKIILILFISALLIFPAVQSITDFGFTFDINICKDQTCTQKSKVFIKNQDIYLNYNSEVLEPEITATLILPDKTTQQLTLPTSIKAEQIGTYTLEITASKQGYKTITKKEQFGIIEKDVEIKSVSLCNGNGICEDKENLQNCPQDCVLELASPKTNSWILIITITTLLIVAAIGSLVLKQRKKSALEEILELKTYIIDCVSKGYTQNQIMQGLLKDGWDKSLVEKAFKTIQQPKKATPMQLLEIQNYMQINLRKGYSKQQIKAVLIKDGWPADEVEQAFNNLRM